MLSHCVLHYCIFIAVFGVFYLCDISCTTSWKKKTKKYGSAEIVERVDDMLTQGYIISKHYFSDRPQARLQLDSSRIKVTSSAGLQSVRGTGMQSY